MVWWKYVLVKWLILISLNVAVKDIMNVSRYWAKITNFLLNELDGMNVKNVWFIQDKDQYDTLTERFGKWMVSRSRDVMEPNSLRVLSGLFEEKTSSNKDQTTQ